MENPTDDELLETIALFCGYTQWMHDMAFNTLRDPNKLPSPLIYRKGKVNENRDNYDNLPKYITDRNAVFEFEQMINDCGLGYQYLYHLSASIPGFVDAETTGDDDWLIRTASPRDCCLAAYRTIKENEK